MSASVSRTLLLLAYLPKHEPTFSCTQNKDITSQGQASDPLGEGHKGLLVPAYPRVNVDIGFILLSSVDMCVGDGHTVYRRRALLEVVFDRIGRAQGVAIDTHVLGDGRIRPQRMAADARDEFFRQHLFFFFSKLTYVACLTFLFLSFLPNSFSPRFPFWKQPRNATGVADA